MRHKLQRTMTKRKIAVVGAGVIGLSAAYRLQTELKDVQVTVISDRFVPNITSAAAAGFWVPHLLGDTPFELQRRWSYETFDYLFDLENSAAAAVAGVTRVSGYHMFHDKNTQPPYWSEKVFGFRKMTDFELQPYKSFKNFGFYFSTLICQQSIYLPWIFEKFKKNGGMVKQEMVRDIDMLAKDFDLVVNCTGTGARDLLNDNNIVPYRGQVLQVRAPWVNTFYLLEDGDNYIIPVIGSVVLGGTHQEGNWDTTANLKDTEHIIRGTEKLVPSLKHAEILDTKVGLRPARCSVRLEREDSHKNIIHNYGHGGCGVTLHWGCAGDVVKMAAQIFTASPSKL